jgi:acyl-coenzyme A synthetase/AMP-(fatty) acid ligase
MYGQTEATARMAYLPAEKSLEKYGSMGIAIPGGRFCLIDVDGKEITRPETVGELVYYGDNVTMGYAECGEDLAKGDERHGRLETGDMAKVDKDGFFYIVGRKKRFLKIFGNRVNLDETEQLLKERFSNFECACSGVDDKMSVYITDGEAKGEVLSFLTEKLKFNAAAFKVVPVAAIPRNESGKVVYNDLPTA